MALMDGLEINIPQEAEVKHIPLQSLPSSVWQKMLDNGSSRSIPDCIWICPAFVQRKGQKDTPQAQVKVRAHKLKALVDRSRLQGSTVLMSFVTANCTAFRVLRETMPVVSYRASSSLAQIPRGKPSNTHLDAVIVHDGHIYLSVKKCGKKNPSEAQVAQPSPAPRPQNNKGPVNIKGLKSKEDLCKRAHDGPPHALNPTPALLSQICTRDQEPTEEPTEQGDLSRAERSPSLAPYMYQSWSPTEPSARQQDLDFQELAHREKIAQMEAKLLQSKAVLGTLNPPLND